MRAAPPLLVALVLASPLAPAPAEGEKPQTQTRPAEHQHSHDATARHPFDDLNTWIGIFDDPGRDRWQKPDRVPAALGLRAGMVVADIGAGTGYFNRRFSEAVGSQGKVLGVDIEPVMVDHMKERAALERTANVIPVLALPDDPKLPDGSVDVIFVCDTWHHIDDRLAYLARLARALKPGGLLAIVDFHKRPLPVGPPPEHKLAREDVLAELAEARWTLAKESDALPYQYFLIFRPPAP